MSSRNLYEVLDETASLHPNAPAIEHGAKSITYSELLTQVNELRAKLLALGVRPGDRVAVMAPRDVVEPALLFAVSGCRAVFTSLNRLWKPAQVAYSLRYLKPQFLIAGKGMANQLSLTDDFVPPSGGVIVLEQFLAAPGPTAPITPPVPSLLDLGAIIFTSGSSGHPKGVLHSNASLLRWTESTVRYLGNRPGDRILAILPLAFGYGLNQLLCMVHCGGCYRISQSVLLPDVIGELAKHEISGLAGIPNFWRDFTNVLPTLGMDGAEFSLRYVTNAGGHCAPEVLGDVRRQIEGTDVFLMYGTTETLRSAYLPPHMFDRKMGAIGVPVPGAQVWLLNSEGEPCQPGEIGEIVHRGPTVAEGYFGSVGTHCDRFRPAPDWLEAPDERVCFTGDLARQDDDGILWFETRRDRQLKVSGFRISPSEIEDVTKQLAFVEDAVALCIKSPDRPESIHVAIALKPESAMPSEDEVIKHLRARVANYMVPSKVHFWTDPFPRTPNGKTDYVSIQRMLPASPSTLKSA